MVACATARFYRRDEDHQHHVHRDDTDDGTAVAEKGNGPGANPDGHWRRGDDGSGGGVEA